MSLISGYALEARIILTVFTSPKQGVSMRGDSPFRRTRSKAIFRSVYVPYSGIHEFDIPNER